MPCEALLAQARARLGLPLQGQDHDVDPAETSTVQQARARLVEAQLNRDRLVRLAEQGILRNRTSNQARFYVQIAPHEERTFRWSRLVSFTPWRAFIGNYSQNEVMREIRNRLLVLTGIRSSVRGGSSAAIH